MKTLILAIVAWAVVLVYCSYQNAHHNKPRSFRPTVKTHVLRMCGW